MHNYSHAYMSRHFYIPHYDRQQQKAQCIYPKVQLVQIIVAILASCKDKIFTPLYLEVIDTFTTETTVYTAHFEY